MAALTRRTFLSLTALLAPAARLRAQPAGIAIDEFLSLSRRLAGRTRLDPATGAVYLNALLTVPENVPLLAQLARGSSLAPGHDALERTIVEWWYTGVYTLAGERRVATHTGALMWSAMNMPAPGGCAGSFGAWSRPPAGPPAR